MMEKKNPRSYDANLCLHQRQLQGSLPVIVVIAVYDD